MFIESTYPSGIVTNTYQGNVADYWNTEANPVNLELGEVDGLFHHHYGIGEPDWSVTDGDAGTARERITKELHRLETRQATLLLDHLGPIGPGPDHGCRMRARRHLVHGPRTVRLSGGRDLDFP
jgi:geranyl diphosphate 2-C-methyltransferase